MSASLVGVKGSPGLFVCVSLIVGETSLLVTRMPGGAGVGAYLAIRSRSWSCRDPGRAHTLAPGNARSSHTACTAGPTWLGERAGPQESSLQLGARVPLWPLMSRYQAQVSKPCALMLVRHVLPAQCTPSLSLSMFYLRTPFLRL